MDGDALNISYALEIWAKEYWYSEDNASRVKASKLMRLSDKYRLIWGETIKEQA
jgi:hypothetical protein